MVYAPQFSPQRSAYTKKQQWLIFWGNQNSKPKKVTWQAWFSLEFNMLLKILCKQTAFFVDRLQDAGGDPVLWKDSVESNNHRPWGVFHHAGQSPRRQRTDLWALQHPADQLPDPGVPIATATVDRRNEPTSLSSGEGGSAMGGAGRDVH